MQHLSPEGLGIVADVAERHAVSTDAVVTLLEALARGNGYQAQFNHPDLGGMGQWSQGGMIMIGDMFNNGLKHRVDSLCNELANLLHSQPMFSPQAQHQHQGGVSLFVAGSGFSGQWWPEELGVPSSTGAQNDMHYAFFPGSRRLAIKQAGEVRIYDAGEHMLSGFSQQQGGGQTLTFTSQFGLVRVADLPLVSPLGDQHRDVSPPMAAAAAPVAEPVQPAAAPKQPAAAATPAATFAAADILKTIEGLAALRQNNILTEEEFAAKKAELLSRL